MQLIRACFNDFDLFNKSVIDWELDFRLLSKNDFSARLNMFSSETFTLGRTSLNGKIEQRGLTPAGFVTIVIPANYDSNYIWLNKKVTGRELLIFPKDRTLDAVSFSDFDNYAISIEEKLLFHTVENLGYHNCKKLTTGNEKVLFLSKEFSLTFHQLADDFLNTKITNQKQHNILINNIIHKLLKYIERSNQHDFFIPQKKKDIALRKAVDVINNQSENVLSIQQLCKLVGVCERTLQYAFNSKYQVSPCEYIKAVRLNKVKRELFLLKDQNINISTLAGKYNFWHMGQFAKDFKLQFGMLPSEI
ncbi:MAG: helix-turn-helix domain-containing protein [Pseudomonadota bacterium]